MLGPRHRLPAAPRRVLVTGNPGSGRTATAARISVILGLPPTAAVRDAWAVALLHPDAELADRADTLVWLDLPSSVWIGRLVLRALRGRQRWLDVSEAWRRRRDARGTVLALEAADQPPVIVRLRSHAEVERWLAGLPHPDDLP